MNSFSSYTNLLINFYNLKISPINKTINMHKCDKCDYETKYKCNLKTHLNRKIPCSIGKKRNKNQSQIIKNESQKRGDVKSKGDTESENTIKCCFCDKIFTVKTNLTRHVKKYCKVKKSNDEKSNAIVELKEELEIVKNKLKILEERPTSSIISSTINNNNNSRNINNYYCVPLDSRSVKHVFDAYFDSDVFYAGPDMVVKLLYEMLFQKDIHLLDFARQKFQYKTGEGDGKLIVDIKNEWALNQIEKEYKKHISIISQEEMRKYESDSTTQEAIENLTNDHREASKIVNIWSKLWCKTICK